MSDQGEGVVLDEPTDAGLAGEYFHWQARGEFRLQRCAGCSGWLHPPRTCCPTCGSFDLRWEPTSGRGTLYTWTVTHYAFHAAYASQLPYVSGVVQTAEGPRILTVLSPVVPEDLAIGMQMVVEFTETPAGQRVAYFRPELGSSTESDHAESVR